MFRQPALPQRRGVQVSRAVSLAAPVGGWNARDSLAAMPPADAVYLDNYFPTTTDVMMREGSRDWAYGAVAKPFTSLLSYVAPTYNDCLGIGVIPNSGWWAAKSGEPYHFIDGSECTYGFFNYANIQTAGGNFLIGANGVDGVYIFDGAIVSVAGKGASPWDITAEGLDTNRLMSPALMHNRIWFVEKASARAWFLEPGAIAGPLNPLDLGAVFAEGGSLLAMASWSLDGGAGLDDYSVFVSTTGSIAVYRGGDPMSADDWALVGVYYIAPPLSSRCFARLGGDLLFLCKAGLFPLSKALLSSSINRQVAVTDKIRNAFSEAARLIGFNEGWQCIIMPSLNALIVNIPFFSGARQYVMNTITGAWCSFSGWNAAAIERVNDDFIYATGPKIRQGFYGDIDVETDNIVGQVQLAFNYFGARGSTKRCVLYRPQISGNRTVKYYAQMVPNFGTPLPLSSEAISRADFPWNTWDVAKWDGGVWMGSPLFLNSWLTCTSLAGVALSFVWAQLSLGGRWRWAATDFVVEFGGVLS